MCLLTKCKTPMVAEKDIEVYKVLAVKTSEYHEIHINGEIGCYYTPYIGEVVEIGEEMVASKPDDKPVYLDFISGPYDYYKIECQGIHSYRNIDATDSVFRHIRLTYITKAVVVKCVIPKGTEFWMGIESDIASKRLVIKEVLKQKTY